MNAGLSLLSFNHSQGKTPLRPPCARRMLREAALHVSVVQAHQTWNLTAIMIHTQKSKSTYSSLLCEEREPSYLRQWFSNSLLESSRHEGGPEEPTTLPRAQGVSSSEV